MAQVTPERATGSDATGDATGDAASALPSGAPPRPPRRALLIAFITILLDLLGFGIIIPIQPFYAELYGASPTVVTLLGASYSLMQFLFVPFWGRLSDRVGRRPVVLVSVGIGGVGYLLFGLAGSLPLLFAARMLSGFGNANIATAQAIIADVTGPEDRARGMGLIGAAFGLGFIFGPALGGFLGQFGLAVPAFGAALLAVGNFVFAAWLLPETNPAERRRAAGQQLSRMEALRRAAASPQVLLIIALTLIATTGFALMEQAIGLFIARVWVPGTQLATDPVEAAQLLQRAAALTSWVLVVIGITAAIVQGGMIGPLSRRYGERRLVLWGLVLLTFGMLGIAWSGHAGLYPGLFVVAVLIASGTGLMTPSLNSLLSRQSPPDDQGGILGLGQSASALGRVAGPAASGVLFEASIYLPFLAAAAFMVLTFSIATALRQPQP